MFCVYAVMYDLTHSDDSIFILMLNTMCYFYMSSVICKVGSLILLNFFCFTDFYLSLWTNGFCCCPVFTNSTCICSFVEVKHL